MVLFIHLQGFVHAEKHHHNHELGRQGRPEHLCSFGGNKPEILDVVLQITDNGQRDKVFMEVSMLLLGQLFLEFLLCMMLDDRDVCHLTSGIDSSDLLDDGLFTPIGWLAILRCFILLTDLF
jgi:hypothetical protein